MSRSSASRVRNELQRAQESAHLHGAYLFHGPAGAGKTATAWWWAGRLLGREDGEEEFWHPDLHVVDPEGAVLRVDEIRALQKELALVPNEGGWRVGLVFKAERMLDPAANALLKTLEEPPDRTSLVLVTTSPYSLPPTVRSRTTNYHFAPDSEAAVKTALVQGGLSDREAWLAAALGGARQAAAQAWAEEHLESALALCEALDQIPQGSTSDALEFAESFRGGAAARARAELFLDVHEVWARRQVESAAQNGDREGALHWLDRAEASVQARREMALRNLNPQLVVEHLLLELRPGSA